MSGRATQRTGASRPGARRPRPRIAARATVLALALLGAAATVPAVGGTGASAAGAPTAAATGTKPVVVCQAASVQVTAGRSVRLALDCAVRGARGGRRWVVRGRAASAVRRAIVAAPRHGRLRGLDTRAGTVRYVPRAGYAGADAVGFRVTRPDGRRYRGTIRIRVVRPAVAATPSPPSTPPGDEAPPAGDGLPALLPPSQPAYTLGVWTPTAYDTCPAAVHDRFAVVGPDGKRYPTWHPAVVTDPATGRPCTFGHEHGRDPRGSDVYDWTAAHLALPGAEQHAGIPFGLATEALDVYAAAHPGTRVRHEDHVGYKVDYENDVRLLGEDGADLGVTCDYLVAVHQGSHSPDALSNNVHELLYAVRCDDGTELIADTIARFGAPGEYHRACAPAVAVATTDNGYPSGTGVRTIPDRGCVEESFLVPAGTTTSSWATYERWSTRGSLRAAGGAELAGFDAAFGVFNPSRYANLADATRIGRTLDLCWEAEANGHRANGVACDEATAGGTLAAYAFNDPRSPFDGTRRDVYLADATVENAGGPRIWWTDPYGEQGSPTWFPGAVCQLVGTIDTSGRPSAQERVFGRNRWAADQGVHAPN